MPDRIATLFITDGRDVARDTLKEARELGLLDVELVVAVTDTLDEDFLLWLELELGTGITHHAARLAGAKVGFAGAIAAGWRVLDNLLDEDAHVFHLEDDWHFDDRPPLERMVELLELEPELANVALVRNAVNRREHAAGGLIASYPAGTFAERTTNGIDWLEHRAYFTTNPGIYPRHLIATGFADPPDAERKYGAELLERGYRFAYLGRADDPPLAWHRGKRSASWLP
jgi:hypothetical protein